MLTFGWKQVLGQLLSRLDLGFDDIHVGLEAEVWHTGPHLLSLQT